MRRPLLIILVTYLAGCGGYMGASEAFRKSMSSANPNGALGHVNTALGVSNDLDLPDKGDADTPLLLLERATILQALGRYEASAKSFQAADKALDVYDLDSDTLGDISKFVFSDDSTVYRSPPHEKLLINTMNLLNYLAMGKVSGAKVEARRFIVNRKFLESREGQESRGMLALGSYLSGLAYEIAGEPDTAMLNYADAHAAGGVPTLEDAVRRLAARTGASNARLDAVIGDAANTLAPNPQDAEVVVIVQNGMTPYRYPERLPIGPAMVIASSNGSQHQLSRKQQERANRFAAKGLLKWVNYPELRAGSPPPSYVGMSMDGEEMTSGVALNVDIAARAEFNRVKGIIIAAAITRLIARAVAGAVAEGVAGGKKGGGAAFLLGLLVEGAMTAADTPDTRSWVTLPAQYYVGRIRLPAGRHLLSITSRGQVRRRVLDLQPGGWTVLNFSDIR